jgi:hypothetical protein
MMRLHDRDGAAAAAGRGGAPALLSFTLAGLGQLHLTLLPVTPAFCLQKFKTAARVKRCKAPPLLTLPLKGPSPPLLPLAVVFFAAGGGTIDFNEFERLHVWLTQISQVGGAPRQVRVRVCVCVCVCERRRGFALKRRTR